jgi:hypothetical protein
MTFQENVIKIVLITDYSGYQNELIVCIKWRDFECIKYINSQLKQLNAIE